MFDRCARHSLALRCFVTLSDCSQKISASYPPKTTTLDVSFFVVPAWTASNEAQRLATRELKEQLATRDGNRKSRGGKRGRYEGGDGDDESNIRDGIKSEYMGGSGGRGGGFHNQRGGRGRGGKNGGGGRGRGGGRGGGSKNKKYGR